MKLFSFMAAILTLLAGQNARAGASSATNTPPGEAVFNIVRYHLDGNTVLPPEKLNFLTNYTGAVTWPQINKGLGELQLLYRNLGYATISVTLPQQSITNGVLEVKVFEGKLESINVVSNRYFSSNNILRALPDLQTNVLLNTKWLQPELDQANLNPDRQIYPVISPGQQPGYTDLTLDVKDRLPLHGHIDFDDKSTPATPLVRVDSALQYNNLWQANHQIGFQYNFSPQQFKPPSYPTAVYDKPTVDSYSAFYRLPLGSPSGLRENYEQFPVDFGYDEITHRFNLPPASGSPELLFFASRSSSDTDLRYSPLAILVTNPLAQITSQSAEQDLSITEDVGAKFNLPLKDFADIHSTLSFGFDYKTFFAAGFSTNLFYFATPITNNGVASVANYTIPLAANTRHYLEYAPLSLGWSGSRDDRHGNWSFNYAQNIFLSPLASSRSNFQAVAGSKSAGGNYTDFIINLAREEKLPDGWSLLARGSTHWASAPLISNEQFPLGGTDGVRGYQEGENYSDAGWKMTLDLRARPYNLGAFPVAHGAVPAYVRPSIFMDYGEGYQLDRPGSETDRQWGTGFGTFLTAGEHFEARLSLGWALLRTPTTEAGSIQAYFSVGTQF
jgi:hemolysin activation/secretion protein